MRCPLDALVVLLAVDQGLAAVRNRSPQALLDALDNVTAIIAPDSTAELAFSNKCPPDKTIEYTRSGAKFCDKCVTQVLSSGGCAADPSKIQYPVVEKANFCYSCAPCSDTILSACAQSAGPTGVDGYYVFSGQCPTTLPVVTTPPYQSFCDDCSTRIAETPGACVAFTAAQAEQFQNQARNDAILQFVPLLVSNGTCYVR